MKEIRKYWDDMAKIGPDRSLIDPNDRRGDKTKYIAYLRDQAILNELNDICLPARILDFGCGRGDLTKTLEDNGYRPVGVDISINQLRFTQRYSFKGNSLFIQYDGNCLPFSSNSFDACVTYEVLQHITDKGLFCRALEEIIRVLKPGGRLIAIEQTRRKNIFNPDQMKLQRSKEEILQLLSTSGFRVKESKVIRRGHFPVIYLINFGLIPRIFFPFIGKFETFLGKVFRRPYFDYTNMIFIAEKSSNKGYG